MQTMTRESWTDDKLDALNDKVDLRFDHVDEKFDRVDRRFDQVDRRLELMDAKIDRKFCTLDTKIDDKHDSLRLEMREGFAALDAKLQSLNRSLLYVIASSASISLAAAGLAAAFIK